jgi:aspartyl-tRNA(Asn)/glutamyl-tRNA(Gln) amidotransferase subunit C
VAISREEVLHVAALAQLELSEEEIARLTIELNDILAAVGKVSELDLSDVPPTSHPLAVVNVFRPDEPRPSLPSRLHAARHHRAIRGQGPRVELRLLADSGSGRAPRGDR